MFYVGGSAKEKGKYRGVFPAQSRQVRNISLPNTLVGSKSVMPLRALPT